MEPGRFFDTFAAMHNLPLSGIADLPSRFDVFASEPGYDPELLAAGLFPPLPICDTELIWGFRIIAAAREAGLSELPVVEVESRGRLLVALKLENRTGDYSWKERLSIYSLARALDGEEDYDSISLAVSGNRGFFSRMERYSNLPRHLRTAVEEGRLDLGIAEKVRGLPADACRLVCAHAGLSFSRVRESLIALAEIRLRDSLSDGEVLSLTGNALAADDPVRTLREIRNPQLTGLTRRFEEFKRQNTRDTGVHLEAPPFFEGDGFTVSFSFGTKEELHRRVRVLEKLENGYEELEALL